MISAYEDKNDIIVDPKKIAKTYICSIWFPVDLISAIPLHLIWQQAVTVKGLKTAKMLKFMRLIRVLKLVRLYRVWPVFAKLEDNPAMKSWKIKATKIACLMFSAFHFFACMWVFL